MTVIADYMTNDEVAQHIGVRVRGHRLGRNMSVEQLADQAGVNRKTVLGFEAGEDIRISSMIKILRGLGLLGLWNNAIPDVLPSGEGISSRGQPRQKASSRKAVR